MHEFMLSPWFAMGGFIFKGIMGQAQSDWNDFMTQQMAISHKQCELWIMAVKDTNEGPYKWPPAATTSTSPWLVLARSLAVIFPQLLAGC